jgi:hypothetical protein
MESATMNQAVHHESEKAMNSLPWKKVVNNTWFSVLLFSEKLLCNHFHKKIFVFGSGKALVEICDLFTKPKDLHFGGNRIFRPNEKARFLGDSVSIISHNILSG